MRLHNMVTALEAECTSVRRDLHQIPELGFEERKTQAYIMNYLLRLNPDSVEKLALTGVKAVFYAKHAVRTLAFRADMDGLPTKEKNIVPYKSQHIGRMHACGHDAHMTMLLMLARLVSEHRDELSCNVVLIFQPGEEGWGGAKRMMDEDVLKNPDVDSIYGFHIWPTVPAGKIGVRWGAMMARTSEFDITVKGLSAHGASPQMGIDAVVTAAELITMLQTVISRNIDPHQDALLTIGRIEGGVARNIIADKVKLYATLRAFDINVFDSLFHHIKETMKGLQTASGAKLRMEELRRYPCVDNPRYMVEALYTLLDGMEDTFLPEPALAAEDFSFYQQSVPGLFMFLGVQGGKCCQPLHNEAFDFDEPLLLNGIEVYRRIIGIGV